MYDYTQAKMNDDAIRAISSIGLAHLGDAVYELLVRTYLCVHGKATGKGLHRATVELVCAPQQARFAEKLLPLLTEDEASVFRRGRNANVHSPPPRPRGLSEGHGPRGAVRLAVSARRSRAHQRAFQPDDGGRQCHLTRSACGQFYTS